MRAIITAGQYRVENGKTYCYLYGRNEDATPARIKIQHDPYFFADLSPSQAQQLAKNPKTKKVLYEGTALDGHKLHKIICHYPFDIPSLRSSCLATYESDIPFVNRVMVDAGIKYACEYTPKEILQISDIRGIDEIDFSPNVVSLDIETDDTGAIDTEKTPNRVLSIAYTTDKASLLYITRPFDQKILAQKIKDLGYKNKWRGVSLKNEKSLFANHADFMQKQKPDVIIGWNVENFDKEYLSNRAKNNQYPYHNDRENAWLDGLKGYDILMKNNLPSRSLENCAQNTLKTGKLPRTSTTKMYEHSPEGLLAYNLWDTELVRLICEEKGIVDFVLSVSKLCGRPLNDIIPREGVVDIRKYSFIATKVVDGYLLHRLKGERIMPTREYTQGKTSFKGAMVAEPQSGLYHYVAVFDFASEYPNIMRSGNISVDTFTDNPKNKEDYYEIVNTEEGHTSYYRKTPQGLLPKILDELVETRAKTKAEMLKLDRNTQEYKNLYMKQWSLKILTNSFYGVLGASHYRLSNKYTASDVTFLAKKHALFQIEQINKIGGCKVLYGDTDSVFVEIPAKNIEECIEKGLAIEKTLNKSFEAFVAQFGWQKNYLKTKFEKLYSSWVQTAHEKDGKTVGKKRYAGFVCWERTKNDDGSWRIYDQKTATINDIDITGYEVVRSDSSLLTRQTQEYLLHLLCTSEKSIPELREEIEEHLWDLKTRFLGEKMVEQMLIDQTLTTPYETLKTIQAKHKAWKYWNDNFGVLEMGEPYRWGYVKNVGGKPHTEMLGVPTKEQIPVGVVWDYQKMWGRVVINPIKHILSIVEIDHKIFFGDKIKRLF